MNSFVNTLYRDLTCAAAAAAISLVVAMSFVQSTSVARTTVTGAAVAHQAQQLQSSRQA